MEELVCNGCGRNRGAASEIIYFGPRKPEVLERVELLSDSGLVVRHCGNPGTEADIPCRRETAALMIVDADDETADLDSRFCNGERTKVPAPVIVLADQGWAGDGCTGLLASAHCRLTKPVRGDDLLSVVRAARDAQQDNLRLREDARRRTSAIGTITSGSFSIRTIDQARNLATMLAQACPEPELAALGLRELMVNAIEHGNLAIDFDLKSELVQNGRWLEEIARRLEAPEYRDRLCEVQFARTAGGARVTIRDDGCGFDPAPFLDGGSCDLAGYNGRGIFMVKSVYADSVIYDDGGRRVTVEFVRPDPAD